MNRKIHTSLVFGVLTGILAFSVWSPLGAAWSEISRDDQAAVRPNAPEPPFTDKQQYLFEIIGNRRTVRNFRPDPVPKNHLLKILDMARMAPTSGNQQPWKFLVVQDRAKIDRLKIESVNWAVTEATLRRKMTAEESAGFRTRLAETITKVLSAPVYIAVLTDGQSSYPPDNRHDGPLAAAFLMIAARSLGYGTGYYTTYFPEARMREFFGIPDRYNLVCFTPIGVPAEWPPAPLKKPLGDFLVFEKFKDEAVADSSRNASPLPSRRREG